MHDPIVLSHGQPTICNNFKQKDQKQFSTILFYNFFLFRLNSWGFSLYYYIISCKLLVYNHAGDYSGKIDLIKTTQWRCQTTKYYLPHGSIQCPLDSFYWILGRFHVWQIQNRSFPPIFLLSYPFPLPILLYYKMDDLAHTVTTKLDITCAFENISEIYCKWLDWKYFLLFLPLVYFKMDDLAQKVKTLRVGITP